MNNFVQDGHALDLVAPSGGVVSGVGYLLGGLFVVAAVTAAEGAPFAGWREGVWTFTALAHASTQGQAVGDVVYWDDTNKRTTKTATGNTAIGIIVETKVTTATSSKVVLVPRLAAALGAITDLSLAAVTGVDGTGSNAASKADVDTRFASIVTKVNAIITALEGAGIIVS